MIRQSYPSFYGKDKACCFGISLWHNPHIWPRVPAMDSPVTSPVSAPALIAALPGWTLPRGREPDDLGAAFAAGIALKSLDDLVRSAPVWAGCWRSRQALKCAAVAVRLMGRSEDEPALRDAALLTAAGDDSGPAGKVLLATKRLSTRKPAFSSKAVAELADLLGLVWDDRLTAAVDHADDALQSGRPAPFAAADLVVPSMRAGGCRTAGLDVGRSADRGAAEMGFCRAAADGRALWADLQDA